MYLAMAPSVFKLPSPASMRSAVSSMYARPASRRATFGTISLCVYPCFCESGAPAWMRFAQQVTGPSGPQTKRRHHQARVTEHGLRLVQTLAFHPADQPVRIHIDVAERKGGRIAEADAVLVFRFVVADPLGAFLQDEPTGTGGCIRQNRVSVGHPAVADPLFAAVDLVAHDSIAVIAVHHTLGGGLPSTTL